MDTKFLVVDKDGKNTKSYAQAVEMLKSGEVVAFPTETVYGLGAVATNDNAVKKIYVAKDLMEAISKMNQLLDTNSVVLFENDLPDNYL